MLSSYMAINDCISCSLAQIFKQIHGIQMYLLLVTQQKENCLNTGELPFSAFRNEVEELFGSPLVS